MTALRVALLHHAFEAEPAVGALAAALARAGHRPAVIAAGRVRPRREERDGVEVLHVPRVPDLPLRVRRIGEHLAHVPAAGLAARAGGFDVVHAFSPSDALAATWAAGDGRAASVVTFCSPVRRERLADRRLRLQMLVRAVERSGAVVAPDEEVRASLWRWLGAEARVLDPADADGHVSLYRELLAVQ